MPFLGALYKHVLESSNTLTAASPPLIMAAILSSQHLFVPPLVLHSSHRHTSAEDVSQKHLTLQVNVDYADWRHTFESRYRYLETRQESSALEYSAVPVEKSLSKISKDLSPIC